MKPRSRAALRGLAFRGAVVLEEGGVVAVDLVVGVGPAVELEGALSEEGVGALLLWVLRIHEDAEGDGAEREEDDEEDAGDVEAGSLGRGDVHLALLGG